ncbi:hypothetical protein ACWC5I_07400 [Kitasatospora sp. NPDC001574]
MKRQSRTAPLEVMAFTGSEESDVLHAAADWIKERPFTIVVAMNWSSDYGSNDNDLLWTLELVVDHSAAS